MYDDDIGIGVRETTTKVSIKEKCSWKKNPSL